MTWQPASVLYPDAELATTNALRTLINAQSGYSDVKVVRTIPTSRPARCVQVVRDGGSSANLRDKPRLRINVWDTTNQKATDLARLIVALVPRMVGQSGVLRTEHLSGPYEIADTTGPRRYLLFQIDYRGEQL